MFWSGDGARDRHVLRGASSPNLAATALRFTSGAGNQFAATYVAANADVDLKFMPLFKGALTGNLYEGFGIHFDIRTGVCTVDAAVPAQVVSNFIVEVTATSIPPGGTTFTEVIRFHVHTSIVRAWLTPSRLTIRQLGPPYPKTRYRFAVRAEFDDQTVGDITVNHGVIWTPSANVDSGGKITLNAGDAVGSDITVNARLPTPAGPVNATAATIHVADQWANDPSPPTASIVPGGGWPGTIRPEAVPNVLFLGDGFSAAPADRTAFERITNSYVHHMKTDKLMRPFDLLATSINFWRTYVAGPPGISVRAEVYTYTRGADTFGRALPAVVKPPATGDWVLSNLLYAVGLPVPGDKTKTNAQLRAQWTATVATDPTPHLTDRDPLIDSWKEVADRAFVDEINAFPGMSYGRPPAANANDNYSLDLHRDRGGVDALKPLYRVIASDSGVALDGGRLLGNLWADDEPSHQNVYFDNTDLIALVTSLPGGRALNGTGYIALATRSGNIELKLTAVAGRRAFTLVPPPTPTDAEDDSSRTMTHELAHSFGVNDEYADRVGRYQPQSDPLTDWSNVETEQNVKDAAGHFAGNQIKWNWHRIKKAGLIDGPITGPPAGPFTIPLQAGHGLQFAVNDLVLLRLRERAKPLTAQPDVLQSTQELKVTVRTANSITVTPLNAGSINLTQIQRFVPGSTVFIPTPAPTSVRSAAYPYAEIVALNVKNAITNQNRPLTPVPCDTTSLHGKLQTPNLTGISLPGLCFKHKPKIIGLYEGGVRFTCGVFHPSGSCMMRNDHESSAEFCHVCRYVIVDFVNPLKHFEIDLDYADVYAQG
jgi:hypothetical protein